MTQATAEKQKATGYDRYIDWKLFSIPLGLFILVLLIPTPRSMLQVGAEYALGSKYVREYLAHEIFKEKFVELNRWQSQMVLLMEASVDKAAFGYKQFLKRDAKWAKKAKIETTQANLKLIMQKATTISPEQFEAMLKAAHKLKKNLPMDKLSPDEMKRVDKYGFYVKLAVATVAFVVGSFVTEAIPLPMVALCVGVIGLIGGIFTRENVASIYWSDSTWFIMGSLMFAAAFVKTGVDRRIALMMFGKLKSPNVRWITAIMVLIISPLTMFMSDHALAAMFLPIGIMLYTATTSAEGKDDPELGKLLMITIAMAANLGGSLAPSGAARNIIMMSYAQEMFGVEIGFGQWMIYCVPFLFFVMPITWLVINWRFKPVITDLGPSMTMVKESITQSGGGKWTRDQKWAIGIFLAMLFCWITETNLLLQWTGVRFGIGVLAVMGAIAYILAGVVNWRDYQTKVDWGVVWLYAGAIAFGKLLTDTGGAYWIASSIVDLTVPLGLGSGLGLLLSGNLIVGFITQLMADGPACAAVGPVTLAMAGIVHPGTSMIPFTTMSTAIASSLAYCLIIGTPPNAIVYASGLLEQKDYLRAGVILFITNLAVLMLMAATYWNWLGFPGLRPY